MLHVRTKTPIVLATTLSPSIVDAMRHLVAELRTGEIHDQIQGASRGGGRYCSSHGARRRNIRELANMQKLPSKETKG